MTFTMNFPFAKILGYAVAAVCVIFSYFIFTGAVLETVPKTYRILFGVVVVLYGMYRAVLSGMGGRIRR